MTSFDVAIIGAGAAGIAAARTLHAAGRRIVVLEARGRVGGRAVVDHGLGAPADLGAAWLHFAEENAWTELARQAGFSIIRRQPGWGPQAHVGQHAPTAAEQTHVADHYQRYFGLVAAAAAAGRDIAVADVLPQDEFRARFDAVMTWMMGAESHSVSTLDLHRYAESGADWAVHEGLGTVVAAAVHGLPVHVGTRVTAIDWSGPRVTIECSAGRIDAAAAIVTLPTALLARGAVRFTPTLPDAHQRALAGLPLGVCNKVFFRLRDSGFAASLPPYFVGSATTSRTSSWATRPADQPLLLAYFGGDLSWELEQRGELEAFARDELRSIFGSSALAEFGPSLATAWGSDECSLGSYSAALPGQAHCREQLAMPVSPHLHFAGEACSINYYGTLHGAWRSGVAAAQRLL